VIISAGLIGPLVGDLKPNPMIEERNNIPDRLSFDG
jgi:hypothetical protein